MASNDELFKRANDVIPGGVNSPVRAFRSVGGSPYFVDRAKGAYVYDVEGKRYIDYVQSYGASILGHAHARVIEAIKKAADDGTTYGAPTEREVLLAEAIAERIGPGCDLVRLVSSGTEATMSAVRVARGATGRDRVVMFEGCYHGHSDGMLAAGGSGMSTLGLPASAGVPKASVAETIVVPYNVVPDIGDDVACVIVEPIAANMGLVPPAPGFLEGLRAACDNAGALLVFDEVITGFRIARGGAAAHTGVRPDLWTFGKVIGGGLPLAAFAGRRAVMEQLAPLGPVYQAGTLSGNPLATAAGLVVLDELDAVDGYSTLTAKAERLAVLLRDAIPDAQVPTAGPLVGLFFADAPVTDYAAAKRSADTGRYAELFHRLLSNGVALAPGAYEAIFPSLAHSDDDLERTAETAAHSI